MYQGNKIQENEGETINNFFLQNLTKYKVRKLKYYMKKSFNLVAII